MTTDERIAALEVTIDELRAEIKRLALRNSMERTLTCPACGGGRIIGVKQVFGYTSEMAYALRLIASDDWKKSGGNILQAYVCKNCCLIEWRTHTADGLVADGKLVIEFDRATEAPPKDATYR
jgi:hypothetical protein